MDSIRALLTSTASLAVAHTVTSIFFLSIASLLLLLGLLHRACSISRDPREPPLIHPRIPYIGHILGLLIDGSGYLDSLSARHPSYEIYTLPLLGARTYIATTPALASAIQRNTRTLSFDPLVPFATRRVLGLDEPTLDILRAAPPSAPRGTGFFPDMHAEVYAELERGDALRSYSAEMARAVGAMLDAPGWGIDASCCPSPSSLSDGRAEAIDLYAWLRHVFTHTTTSTLYGASSPLLSPSLRVPLWTFITSIPLLLLFPLPRMTCPGAHAARERLASAFHTYFAHGHDTSGSTLIRTRAAVSRRHGMTEPMLARAEASFLFAALVNAAPTIFWAVNHIYASAPLLRAVRAELRTAAAAATAGGDADHPECLDPGSAPLLASACREAMRVHSRSVTVRAVLSDTLLPGGYLLRAGATVQVAGGVIHGDARLWGGDAREFRAGRFLGTVAGWKTPGAEEPETEEGGGPGGKGEGEKGRERVHPAAFRAFGGGATLCPGRYLAVNEIFSFVAAVVHRFELEDVRGGSREKAGGAGAIPLAEPITGGIPIAISGPKRPLYVRVIRRENGGLGRDA